MIADPNINVPDWTEPQKRLCTDLHKKLEYYGKEYDLTYCEVLSVLSAITHEVARQGQQDEAENDDDGDDCGGCDNCNGGCGCDDGENWKRKA